jgi:hypothetical protein
LGQKGDELLFGEVGGLAVDESGGLIAVDAFFQIGSEKTKPKKAGSNGTPSLLEDL